MKRVKTGGMIVGCGLLAMTVAGCLGSGKPADGNRPATTATTAADNLDAPVKPEARYKVTAEQADFFHISVQQPGGADEQLKRDTPVTLLKSYGGYCQVQAHGSTGYVATADITRRSAQEIAAEDAATLARQAPPNALAPMTSGPGGTYAIPPEATRDTVLPVQDNGPTPKPTPNAMFRY